MHRGRTFGCLLLLILSTIAFTTTFAAQTKASPPGQLCAEGPTNPVLNDSGLFSTYLSGVGHVWSYSTDLEQPSVMARAGRYSMWIGGFVNNVTGIYQATSTDGVVWNLDSKPELTTGAAGSWDAGSVYSPSVVWNGTKYLMYFTGNNGTGPASRSIGVAFSTDGASWTEYAHNPVISHGPGIYDAFFARFPSVVFDDGVYKMWYTGAYPVNHGPHPAGLGIDYATSSDGVHWNKYSANPVFVANGTSDAYFVESPSVVKIEGAYVMAYDDNGANISLAFSPDGVSWTATASALSASGSGWDSGVVFFPALAVNGSTLLLWHYGQHYNGVSNATYNAPYTAGIGLATCGFILVSSTETLTETNVVTTVSSSVSTVTATLKETSTAVTTVTNTATATEVSTVSASGSALASYVAVAAVVLCVVLGAALITQRARRRTSAA